MSKTKRKPKFLKLPNETAQTAPPVGMAVAKARLAAVGGVPDDIQDPVAFVEAERKAMLPQAIIEKKWQLYFGDDDQRDKVASEILAMEGFTAKRDQGAAVPPAIVVVNMPASPFAKRVDVTVDATPNAPKLKDGGSK